MKEKKCKHNPFNNNNKRMVIFIYKQLDSIYLGEVT